MSCNTTDDVRIIMKYSTISGATPSIPLSDNHEDGTWIPTDLYIGEFFTNAADDTYWIRTDNGISQLFGGTGGTGSFIGDFVHISGGTFSGLVFAPTFSANYLVGGTVSGDTITADYFIGGTYSGDGSLLTGIVATWLGGTVSNGVYFTNEAKFTNDTWLDGNVYSTSGINISGSVSISGGILTSDYFVGDGSGLTNLPTGTYSDIYTTGATLSGDTIIFTRNDSNTYDIDLTPILNQQSITTMTWDSSTDELLTTFNDASTIGLTIDSFAQVSSTGPITAPEFYGGIFYGEFVGTFSNDIYTISGTLSGTDEIFTRTDGSTFSVDLSSLAGGGGTQSLQQTLSVGNTTGPNWINVDSGYGLTSSGGGVTDTISLDPTGVSLGTGIKSENTTNTNYSQTTYTPTNILSTITDNGYGYFSSKEIKPQQHQSQFSRQANIFTIEDKRAGWMQTADDIAALMIYCDVDGSTGSTSSIVQIKAHVRGISSDKLTGYAAEITSWVRFDQLGPTVITQIGTVDYTIKSEFTTANSSFVISGPNMYIDVTGEIGITIDWTCNVEILYDKNTF